MSYVKLGALSLIPALAAGAFLAGCGNAGDSEPAPATAGAVQIPDGMEHIADLPKADQEAALKQRICPVSEELLGSMKGIKKVSLEDGREVFICCAGCESPLKQDPDKYLANLKNAK